MTVAPEDRRLVRLAVAICAGDWPLLREIRSQAPPGEPNRRWREAVLQTHLFAGFPRIIEAWGALEAAGGLGEPSEGAADAQASENARAQAGRALFDRIYADQAPRVRQTLQDYHPVLARWIEAHAYGRVLARPGLSPATRELLAVACLSSLGQDRQLASHVRGALHVGATRAELYDTLAAIEDLLEPEVARRALRVLDRFAPDGESRG